MKSAYLITKSNGSTVLLFDRGRALGIAGHFGWTVKTLTAGQAKAHIKDTLTRIN